MVIDFNAPNSANNSGRSSQAGAANGKREAGMDSASTDSRSPQTATPTSDTAVNLSSQAQQLQAIEDRLKQMPEVDSQRVAELRDAIANGSYQIDSGRIADKLLASEG